MEHFDHGVRHFEAYIDFIMGVVLCAPDDFPAETFLKPEDQLDLETAFRLLRDKFPVAARRLRDRAIAPPLRAMLDASLEAYRAGDILVGAHALQNLQHALIEHAEHRGYLRQ